MPPVLPTDYLFLSFPLPEVCLSISLILLSPAQSHGGTNSYHLLKTACRKRRNNLLFKTYTRAHRTISNA